MLVLCKLISCGATQPTSHFNSGMWFSFLSIQTERLNLFDGNFGFQENKRKAVAIQKHIWRCAFPTGTRIYQSSVDISGVVYLPTPYSSALSIWSRDFFLLLIMDKARVRWDLITRSSDEQPRVWRQNGVKLCMRCTRWVLLLDWLLRNKFPSSACPHF